MTHRIDCIDARELAQLKADVIEQGYRYIVLGLTVRYWRP